MARSKRPYISLQDWMERTGTPGTELAKLAKISQSHMSKILSGSRRCSLEKAYRLSQITGVPMEKMLKWRKTDPASQYDNTTAA